MRVVTFSEISTFKSCRLKHHLMYEELLAPRQPSRHLRFGKAIHNGLHDFHIGGCEMGIEEFAAKLDDEIKILRADPELELWDEDYQQFAEEHELGRAMLARYDAFNAAQEPLEVVELEYPFDVRLKTPTGRKSRTEIAGKVDGIVKDGYGNMFILEHKTAGSIDSKYIANLDLDDQINAYIWALAELGYPIKGVVYNVLAKWIPHPPELIKSGKLSTNKKQRTTFDLYMKAIEENGLAASDYTEMLDMLQVKGDKTFLRLKVYRNKTEIERIGHELYQAARDMAKPSIYRNPGACKLNGCSVRSLCIEDGPEARMNFRIKKARHEELEEVSNGDETKDSNAGGYDF